MPKGTDMRRMLQQTSKNSSFESSPDFSNREEKIDLDKNHEQCKNHGEMLEYFCPQCEEVICVTCTCDPQHIQHCEQIEDFKTCLEELKESMNELRQEFKQNAKKVEEYAKIVKQDTDTIKEYKDALSAKCREVEIVLNQIKEQLQVITELYEPLTNSQQEINTHFTDVRKQMTEINNLQQGSDINFIRKIKECRRNCDRVMNDTQMILNRKITIPGTIKHHIADDVAQVKAIQLSLHGKVMSRLHTNVTLTEKPQIAPDTQQVRRPSPKQINELNNLELLLEINPEGTIHMINPLEVVSVGDGTVFLVDEELNYLQRINTDGEVVRKYQSPLNEQVKYKTASVYGDYLFVATSDDSIRKMSLDGSNDSITCKPKGIREIVHISAIGENVILITDRRYNGRISEYNTEKNMVTNRVTNVWYPGKVSVIQDGVDTKYIFKCYNPMSHEWVLNKYNRTWNMISTMDKNPDVLLVTPGGKLFIVYKNKIHEHLQDGTFIREQLLDK